MAQEHRDVVVPGQEGGTQPAVLENGKAPEETAQGAAKSKADKRKEKKQKQKQNKQLRRQQQEERQQKSSGPQESGAREDGGDDDIVIEYVSAPLDLEALSINGNRGAGATHANGDGSGYALGLGFGSGTNVGKGAPDPLSDFKRVFERFASAEQVTGAAPLEATPEGGPQAGEDGKAGAPDKDTSDGEDEEETAGGGKKVTKKERKALQQLKIAQLKQVCERPEVVEVWDVTAQDPELLVYLKAYRNTVSVPRHWSTKRKYLQGKRGLEKPPFRLPDFIEATGIARMREAYVEKEAAKKMQAKLRERMQPKMGRMDIDYQVLHDAFFKYQTKPKLTHLGDIYYEGKEFEADPGPVRPGYLSPALREALGMADGAPPPWLINMQRYGPPPSYPSLRIPGLNAPIPPGAQFGYHPGGWGKPPVDETGAPLYGDVFGVADEEPESEDDVDKVSKWGEVEPDLEESSEEEGEGEEGDEAMGEEDEEAVADGIASGMVSGLVSGIASSLPSGVETPEVSVQLRKGAESAEPTPALYTVLEQRKAAIGQGNLFGSDHVYVIPGAGGAGGAAASKKAAAVPGGAGRPGTGDVEIALTPDEIEGLDEAGIRALYDQKMAEARAANRREDFSDLVAEKAAQQKRKIQQKADAAKKQKTGTDFKF